MQRKLRILTFALLVFYLWSIEKLAADDKTFVTRVKGAGLLTASAATTDGGYITVSNVGSLSSVVRRINGAGRKVWERKLDFSSGESASLITVAQTPDKGFLISGYLYQGYLCSSNDCYDKAIIVKLRSDGSVSWKKQYGRSDRSIAITSISARPDSGFLVSGTLFQGFPGTKIEGFLARFTSQGDILWEKNLEFSENVFPYPLNSVGTTDNQSVIVLGNPGGAIVLKVDDAGNTIWKKSLNITGFALQSIGATQQNRVVLAGTCNRCQKVFLIELNSDGTVHWKAKYSLGTSPIRSLSDIVQVSDGGYALAGTIENTSQKKVQGFVFNINSSRKAIVQETFGVHPTSGNSIFGTSDGGFVVFGTNVKDLLFLKMNSSGNVLDCDKFVHPFRSKLVAFGDLQLQGIEINESRTELDEAALEMNSSVSNHQSEEVCK